MYQFSGQCVAAFGVWQIIVPSSSRTESLIDGSALPPGTHTMCGTAAFAHSSTGLLGSQTCNHVTRIQPHGWIAAPCRTGLSSTLISDNVCTNMEWIKNESSKSSALTEFLQRTTACWPGKTPRSRSRSEALVASIDLSNFRQRQW